MAIYSSEDEAAELFVGDGVADLVLANEIFDVVIDRHIARNKALLKHIARALATRVISNDLRELFLLCILQRVLWLISDLRPLVARKVDISSVYAGGQLLVLVHLDLE